MPHILHLVSANYFDRLPPGVPYTPREFARDGFIHCTQDGDMMLEIANAFYTNAAGRFQVLVIDESRVTAEVRYEPPAPSAGRVPDAGQGHLFPHIYGPLNRDAIIGIVGLRREPDGSFAGYERALD